MREQRNTLTVDHLLQKLCVKLSREQTALDACRTLWCYLLRSAAGAGLDLSSPTVRDLRNVVKGI